MTANALLAQQPMQRGTVLNLARLARLRFLTPEITLAVREGRQPAAQTPRSRLRIGKLPVEWQARRRAGALNQPTTRNAGQDTEIGI